MKKIICCLILINCLFACNPDDKQSEILKAEILTLQSDIRIISNELEGYSLQGLHYLEDIVASKIDDFTEKRTLQDTKIRTLEDDYNEEVIYETIVCGNFESINCFVENWDVRKPNDGTLEITSDCSYNGTNALRLSAPFIENTHNIPGIEIEGFINGIEASTIYKVRFWAKYSGTSDLSNGPLVKMIVIQDGDWLDYIYEGSHQVNENKVVDEDWKLYSFQIATLSDSPLEIIFGTNLDNVCVDDIHIVKKDQ